MSATSKQTARAEIYDIAKECGFDVEVSEGVERKSYDRRTGWGNEKVEYVTRFLLRYSDESKSRLVAVGARHVKGDEFTVLFKDVSDAFADAWQRSEHSYLNAERPWTSNNHSLARIGKANLIAKLQKQSVERLVGIYEKRRAEEVAQAHQAHLEAIQAHHDAVDASNKALRAAGASLANKLGFPDFTNEQAERLIKVLVESGEVTEYVNSLTRVQMADRNRDAKAERYLQIAPVIGQ